MKDDHLAPTIFDDEQRTFTLLGLISAHLPTINLGALACCSHATEEAVADELQDGKKRLTQLLRDKLSQSSWGPTCCREGAARLSLDGQVAATDLSSLIRYCAASGAKELKLRNCYVGRKGIQHLANAAGRGLLDNLHTLNLSHDFINDDGIELLAERGLASRGCLARLRTLNLSNNAFTGRGLKALCAALCATGALPGLTCLRIAGTEEAFDDAAVRVLAAALAEHGALSSLQQLVVPRGQERHPSLLNACRTRRIRLV